MQVREDSFPAVTDPVLSLASVEARAVWNPSPAMGLIRRGFFGPRVVSPFRFVEEASLSIQGCKDSQVEADENPTPAKGLICRGCLGLEFYFSIYAGGGVAFVSGLLSSLD
jgi:hypothetical protein